MQRASSLRQRRQTETVGELTGTSISYLIHIIFITVGRDGYTHTHVHIHSFNLCSCTIINSWRWRGDPSLRALRGATNESAKTDVFFFVTLLTDVFLGVRTKATRYFSQASKQACRQVDIFILCVCRTPLMLMRCAPLLFRTTVELSNWRTQPFETPLPFETGVLILSDWQTDAFI